MLQRLQSLIAAALVLVSCQAWSQRMSPTTNPISVAVNDHTSKIPNGPSRPSTFPDSVSRRQILAASISAASTLFVTSSAPAARAGLLDDYGADPKNLEKKASAVAYTPGPAALPKSQIDPTLRSSYYYPTAKKRYLPRIQKLSQEIVAVPGAIAEANWDLLQNFEKTADNAVLPLQLYQSSLDGQGLSLTTEFGKRMKADALQFQKAYQLYNKALTKRDVDTLRVAVADMATAVSDYRQQGRLTDDLDGSQIPSLEEMRRMAMRRPTMKQ